jgi:hypothetical protein
MAVCQELSEVIALYTLIGCHANKGFGSLFAHIYFKRGVVME